MKKRLLTVLVIGAAMISTLSGCGGKEDAQTVISNQSKPVEETVNVEQDEELTPEEIQKKENFANSDAEHDTDVGLKNIKIDTAQSGLTDEQKAVLEYFDSDYFEYIDYEFLRRYPQVFDGTQISIYGTVIKTLVQDGNEYSLVVQVGAETAAAEEYIVINGTSGSALFIEGDCLRIYGRYQGVETINVDSTSYTVPCITVFNAYFVNDVKFDASDIKQVARAVFGDNVDIRYPILGTEIEDGFSAEVYEQVFIAELENQSNAKFSKYFLYSDGGRIDVAAAAYGVSLDIERYVEFSADFKHFFLFTYDWSLETLTLEYYDQNLNKIWKREFEEITPPETEGEMTRIYDYTKNNVYCLINNELYIINIENGEDTYSPLYVGKKIAVRKLDDGILLVSYEKSDGIMKISLDGNMMWKTNTTDNNLIADGVQIVDDTVVLELVMVDSNYCTSTHYIVLDKENGSIIIDAVHK